MNPNAVITLGRRTVDVLAKVQRLGDQLRTEDWFALNQLAAETNRLLSPIADDPCLLPSLNLAARELKKLLLHEQQVTNAHIPDEWLIAKLCYP